MADEPLDRAALEALTARYLTGEISREAVERAVYETLKEQEGPPVCPPDAAERARGFATPTQRSTFTLSAEEFRQHAAVAIRLLRDRPVTASFFTDGNTTALVMEQTNAKAGQWVSPAGFHPSELSAISYTFMDC